METYDLIVVDGIYYVVDKGLEARTTYLVSFSCNFSRARDIEVISSQERLEEVEL